MRALREGAHRNAHHESTRACSPPDRSAPSACSAVEGERDRVGLRYPPDMHIERTIQVSTHGRYLADVADSDGPRPLLVGFHGYAEQAAIHLARLRAVRGDLPLDVVAVQGLHRFYRSGGEELAASWMTREDRDLLIADNVAYVDAVVGALAHECGEARAVFFNGFSQGASMAYRSAVLGRVDAAGVVALGGDVPPELTRAQLARIPRVLIGWGVRDGFYDEEKRLADEARLRDAGVDVTVVELDAGHKWTEPFTAAVSAWLRPLV